MQNPHVLQVCPPTVALFQDIEGMPENQARKQRLPVSIASEGPRLADQRPNQMTIVDGGATATPQTLHLRHPLAGVVHLDALRIEPEVHPLADQPRCHRVDVLRRPQRRKHADPHSLPPEIVQARERQIVHPLQLLAQFASPAPIAAGQNHAQKRLVLGPRRKLTAPAQQQSLLDGPFEAVVRLLDIAILVATARCVAIGRHLVMRQRSKVTVVENAAPIAQFVGGRREVVRPVQLGHLAHLPDGRLEAADQGLEALRKTDPARLPIRIRQDKVEKQVVETLAPKANLQLVHAGEVTLGVLPGTVLLGEENLALRTVQRPPATNLPLQRTKLAVRKAQIRAPLQRLEDRHRLQTWRLCEHRFDLWPDRRERVRTGPIPPWALLPLAGKATDPMPTGCVFAHPRAQSCARQ